MGSSESKPVTVDYSADEIQITTPDQFQYTFIPAQPAGCCLFGVKAAWGAYVALSSKENNPEYEILIGKSNNTNIVIKKRGVEVTKTLMPNVLHENQIRFFWLKWKDNKLLLGRKDDQHAFASFNDHERIPIKFLGVCTCGSTGTWTIKKNHKKESQTEARSTRNEPTASTTSSSNSPTTGHPTAPPPSVSVTASSSSLNNSTSTHPTAPPLKTSTATITAYSSKYSLSFAGSSTNNCTSIYPTVSPHNTTKTQENCGYPDLITKKLNTDAENIAKINNVTNKESTHKTNPVNYLNNFKDLNIKNSCNKSQSSTSNDNLENLEKFFLGTETKTEGNETSKGKSRKHHRRDGRSRSTGHRKPHSSSNENNFKKQHECENIISFGKLVEISRKSPEQIIIELRPYKFEQLFEIKLKRSYINVMLGILSKLCQADFLGDKKSVITSFFSKEAFRKELLNHMDHMRLQTDEDYNKYLRYSNEMWESLYIVCKTAVQMPSELHSGYLENLIFECHNTLVALMSRDETRKNVLEKFAKLKEYVYFETRRRPLF